jgi:hypothetical protein
MDKYMEWLALDQELKVLKAKEQMLRKELCEELFEGRVGEFKVDVDTDIYEVRATSKVNRKIDEQVYFSISEELSKEEKDCIKFKPSLDVRKWRKLPEDCILNEAIVESPAMPVLEVTVKVQK